MKHLFLAALATAALAACNSDDIATTPAPVGQQMQFKGGIDNVTRTVSPAEATLASVKADVNGFNVYAYCDASTGANNKYNFYANVKHSTTSGSNPDQTAATGGGYWSYENTQYWQPGVSYQFYAYYPNTFVPDFGSITSMTLKTDSDGKPDPDNLYIYTPSVTGAAGFSQANIRTREVNNTGNVDLLYASAQHTGASLNNPVVNFDFKHALSKVDIRFEYDFENHDATDKYDYKIVINNLQLVSASKGDFGIAIVGDNCVWNEQLGTNPLTWDFNWLGSSTGTLMSGVGSPQYSTFTYALPTPKGGYYLVKFNVDVYEKLKTDTNWPTTPKYAHTETAAQHSHRAMVTDEFQPGVYYQLVFKLNQGNILTVKEPIKFNIQSVTSWGNATDVIVLQ